MEIQNNERENTTMPDQNTQQKSARGNILVVDDTPQNLRLLTEMLTEKGYKVRPSPNGNLAIKSALSTLPDLVLLDINMSGMDGYEVCRQLKAEERTRDIPIIFLSAYGEISDKLKAFQVGGIDYITKPFQMEEVLARVETQIALKKAFHEAEKNALELKKSLDFLKLTQSRLINTEKMAALGILVAGVAHEINTPLGVGVTAASFLADMMNEMQHIADHSNEQPPARMLQLITKSHEASKIILRNLNNAAELITSFKQVAVDQTNDEKRLFNFKKYLDDILFSLRPKLKQTQHKVTINCPDDIVIESYPGAFSQLFTNFIINSILHGFENIDQGEIKIEVEKKEEDLHLRYFDNGKGMDETQLERVFDPFYTTKRGQGSSGLGMYIASNLVYQKLNGEIECVSSPDEGITIDIRVPLA